MYATVYETNVLYTSISILDETHMTFDERTVLWLIYTVHTRRILKSYLE